MNNIEQTSNGTSEDKTDGFNFSCFMKSSKEIAKVPSGKYDLYYKMEQTYRGVAVILNHENFDVPRLKVRHGTNEDKKNLENTLMKLGFHTFSYYDLTTPELFDVVEKYSKMNHSDYDCFVMCILTHGDQGCLYSKNSAYKHEDIFYRFTADKCKTLAGKPKMFFIQACQGDQLDAGTPVVQTDGGSTYKIPVHADFLVAYSTVPGYYSWRNTTRGSWFIQSLCAVLDEYAYQYDLLTLLTMVNQKVALDFESNVPGDKIMHAKKEASYVTFTLMRLIQFNPKPLQPCK